LAKHQAAPVTADVVLPLSSGPDGGTVGLNTTASQLSETFSLPLNIERAELDVFAQSQANDEFWYTCVPNDVAGELQSCGGTAFREAEVSIGGEPAGVAPVYPWIYTGGIDPLLWRPNNINFSNLQRFNITATDYVQDIKQQTSITSLTTRAGGGANTVDLKRSDWPLTLNFEFVSKPDGTFAQTTSIWQALNSSQLVTGNGRPFFSTISNVVAPTDTLLFDANFNITGGQGQASSQEYFTRDSTGYCYSRQIAAAS